MENLNSIEYAQHLDEIDPLKEFRNEFLFPKSEHNTEESCIYLCGNSLGLQPKGLKKLIDKQLDKWADFGVEGHFTEPQPWLTIDNIIQESMSKLVGALPSEVVMMNSLTANIHFMMCSFYHPTPNRYKIIIEKKAFPSDTQAVMSQIVHHGYDPSIALIEISPRIGEEIIYLEDILRILDVEGDNIAIVFFSGVQYYTGQFFDIPSITKKGHDKGCIVGFDLAHAVGNVPLSLHEWEVDFACWCSYKYMNCGPGSIGGCYVHEKHTQYICTEPLYSRHLSDNKDIGSDSNINTTTNIDSNGKDSHESHQSSSTTTTTNTTINNTTTSTNSTNSSIHTIVPRLAGWWGHRISDRFHMTGDFIPESGVYGFRVSNPPVLLISCVRASLDLFDRTSMIELRQKSLQLTGYLESLLLLNLSTKIEIFTPKDPLQRGCQLSITFRYHDIDDIYTHLKIQGIICDIRKPNVMRIAPTPLYNSYVDVWKFVHILSNILQTCKTVS